MSKRLLTVCLTAIMMVVGVSAYALDKVGNVYQIGTAADWEEFAALVNGGEFTACAELTADIDLGLNPTMIGKNDNSQAYHGTFDGKGHTIKINMYPEDNYGAIFRYVGWRAVIQNLKVEGTINSAYKFAAGIAGRVRGTIRNCWADVKIISTVPGGDGTHGGLAATCTNGTIIENCLVKVIIDGGVTHSCGGVIGWADSNPNIVNCLVINDGSNFNLSDGTSRNICRNDGKVQVVDLGKYNQDSYNNRPGPSCYNNYVTNNWGGSNPSVTVVPLADLADGKICYQLNNDQSRIGWVQRIGIDPFPVPAPFGSGRVYASVPTDCNGKADGEISYSNSGVDQSEKHEFDKYGICTKCGLYDFHYFDPDDPTRFDPISRSILIGSKEEVDLAEGMSRIVNGFKLHIRMVNDIEYIAEPGHFIFNTNDWTEGNFDGGGHELTIEMTEMGNNAALFPQRHYGTVENLIMHGRIETNGMYWGSISNDSYESAVRNVYSDIDFVSSHVGDNTAGGFFGMIRTAKNIENCIYAGTITLPGTEKNAKCARVGGFAGWTHAKSLFRNCAVTGRIIGAGNETLQSETENSGNIARNYANVVCENVYVVNPITGRDITDQDKYTVYDNGEDGIASGELAYFMNGKKDGVERFYQRIGVDDYPVPVPREGGKVYVNTKNYLCNGTPLDATYQNTYAGEPNFPPHHFVEGICDNVVGTDPITGEDILCGALQENYAPLVDGWYEISTPAQFIWWSKWASKHLDASAKLTDDIDLEEYQEIADVYIKKAGEDPVPYVWPDNKPVYCTRGFEQVGSEFAPFYGCFDGQCHTISHLNIYLPGKRGVGLISVMNSQPDDKLGERNLTADQARAEEGVYVKDVVLDETCSIYGGGYTGIVGMTSNWGGHITIKGCMNLGNVLVDAGTNGAGIFGCAMGSSCRATINACGMIGDIHVINDTHKENGSFSGWLGSYAEVTNCFALGTVDYMDANRGFARHAESNQVVVKNCYALDGAGIVQKNYDGKAEDVSFVTKEDLATGKITWKANGSQFRDPVWYQTLDEDDYPYPFSTHGVIIYAAEEYMAITDETLPSVASVISAYYTEKYGNTIAYQNTLTALEEKLEELNQSEDVLALADALDSVYVAEKVVKASEEVYKKYQRKCQEVKDYLDSHDDFAGEDRDALESYLENDYVEIIENHELADSLIEKEAIRVSDWLDLAIKNGYIAGTEVTNLFVNADFHNDFKDGWKSSMNKWATDRSSVSIGDKTFYGSEAWNTKFDMHQTVKDLKPGYYLVGVQGAFRPSNNRYLYNYAAQVYANDNVNYLQTVIEDYVEKANAINGENVYINQIGGGNTTYDLAIYDDYYSTDASNGADTLGYAVHGPSGMAVAGYAGRYFNYTIAKAEGDSLTIGLCNPGTNYGNDWTGFSSFKIVYAGEGEEAEKYIDVALESMVARANAIIEKYRDEDLIDRMPDEAMSPSYPEELKETLLAAIAAADGAQGVEGKMKAVENLSQLFKEFYEARQAYLALINSAHLLDDILVQNLSLVEKDPVSNEWIANGEHLINDADVDVIENLSMDLYDIYYGGTYTTEQAREAKILDIPILKELIPTQDEDGYYQIFTPKQFVTYRTIAGERDAYAKAKLMNDVDMTGIAMAPIGHNKSGENAVHIYRGVLDGQGHALNNVYIDEQYTDDPASLFYELKSATVKNFKLTGEYFNTQQRKFMGGLTRWTSENSTIENCEIEVVMHSFIEGDGTHGGVVGIADAGTVINNCVVNVTMIGESENATTNCGGVVGWANKTPTISNTLILSQFQNIAKGDNSNVIGRNGFTANNVFYAERSNPGFDTGGTLATEEQLASGEICWKLNGSKVEDAHWFQKIGTDATPHLFSGNVVWYSDGEYVNRRPNVQLNAFASNLSSATNADQVIIAYTLNAEAKSGAINFYAGEELKYSHVLKGGDLMEGGHEIAIENSLLNAPAGTKMTYELDITGMGVKTATKVGDSYKVWGPYGMAINNNPASKGFGQILLAESYPTAPNNTKYISGKKNGAIFAFDANFQPINSIDGTPGFYGDVPNAAEEPLVISGTYKFDFKDLRFTEDGRLFVARASGTTNSSVWEINPEDLNEPWKPVFTGGTLDEATGITYVGEVEQNRAALSLAFEGKGADLKMYVLGGQRSDGGNNASDYNCSVYNLGTATEWTGAPSAVFEPLNGQYTYSSQYVGIHEDGQGGLWYIQHVSSPSAEYPILKHYNTAGVEDYSQANSGRNGARMAFTSDGKYIAMPNGSGSVIIYQKDYVLLETGKIQLTPKQIISVSETSITSLAFDYANNLYVASAGSETFSRYAIPSWNDNKCVTPAPEGFVVGTESGDPDGIKSLTPALSEGEGAIYNMAGQRVSKAQKGIYIQDGKKVATK